ncbi:MAG: excinuclease ABC subunit UvrC [Pseudomonadota bacterium]
MDKEARAQIDRAPASPGVYLLKDKGRKILYVGKAKSLRSRLRAYLHPERDERPSVSLLVPQVREVEWILTDNEKEALLLENSLIKAHRPRYNILLRDDKSYVSLKLTPHPFPRLFVTRKIVKDGAEYFGPYSSAYDLRETLTLIQKIFRIRDCNDTFFQNRSRPCLQFQIRRCTAPCVGYANEDEYAEQVRQVRLFLSGERKELLAKLRSKMSDASGGLRYEEAAVFRDRFRAVQETLEPQQVESRRDLRNADAVGIAGDQAASLVKVLKIRVGRITGAEEFLIGEPVSAAAEILRAFLQQYYLSETLVRHVPEDIFIPWSVADSALFEALLGENAGRKVRLLVPRRGAGMRWLGLAQRNALSSLEERKRKSELNRGLLESLKRALHLKQLPRRIEGYDISDIGGAEPYGSLVVFSDGEPDKTQYRYYRIRSVKGSNDFAMLREVFERRFRRLDEDHKPDLVLVDGGKGQLRQIVEVAREIGIGDVDLASIAKEKEFRSRSGRTYAPERIFLPGQKNPIVFPSASPVLHLMMRVRDEAHRFGITRHRKSRGKKALESILNRIPGVGPRRLRALIRFFGTLERIREAPIESLQSAPDMTAASAQSVFKFFRASSRTGPDSDE